MSAGEFRDLYKLQDDKTEKIPMIMNLFVRCPVMFTLNDYDKKKLQTDLFYVITVFEFPNNWQSD
jgi:hypothetical protein